MIKVEAIGEIASDVTRGTTKTGDEFFRFSIKARAYHNHAKFGTNCVVYNNECVSDYEFERLYNVACDISKTGEIVKIAGWLSRNSHGFTINAFSICN